MSYSKKKHQMDTINIDIDSSQLDIKRAYLHTKYDEKYKYFSCCISGFNWYDDMFIVDLCNHESCNKFFGFLEDYDQETNTVSISTRKCYVLEPENNNNGFLAGSFLTTSGILGCMKIGNNEACCRVGLTVKDQDNILFQKVIGYDRQGLIFEPVLSNDNPVFGRLPITRFIDINGLFVEEFQYYQDQKRCTVIADIKTKKIDIPLVEKIRKEDAQRLARLTRPTTITSTRNISSATLKRANSSVNLLKRTVSRDSMKPIVENTLPVKKSIYKIFLLPIF